MPPKKYAAAIKLEKYLTERIAVADGVSVEDVTDDYIANKRQTEIYPNAHYDDSESELGGYNKQHLRHLSRNETKEIEAKNRSAREKL